MFTVTVAPPGLTVSVPVATAEPAARVTTEGLPGDAVPDAGETVSAEPRDDKIDQFTAPPEAVRVMLAEAPTLIVTDVGLTVSVGGGRGGVVVLVFGAGELGLGLVSVGLGEAL